MEPINARALAALTLLALAIASVFILLIFFSNPEGLSREAATSELTSFTVRVLILAAVAGFAAMATLEVLKRLLYLRGRFLRKRIPGPEFIRGRQSIFNPVSPSFKRFDLPVEQLTAQLNYAADRAVEELYALPFGLTESFSDPLRSNRRPFTKRGTQADPADYEQAYISERFKIYENVFVRVQEFSPESALGDLNPEFFQETERFVDRSQSQLKYDFDILEPFMGTNIRLYEVGVDEPDSLYDRLSAFFFLRALIGESGIRRSGTDPTKLRAEIQAALDNFQVEVGNAWRLRLRLSACLLAAIFAVASLIYVPAPPGLKIAVLVTSFLIGGFLAGFFRDAVAVVERWRRP